MRLAVVGCGSVFERLHLPAIARSDDWTLCAACDLDADRRGWLRDRCPDVALHGSLEELIGSVSPDGIMILTPAASHARLATVTLREGIPTFVEKPMAVDVRSALQIQQAAAHGVPLQVGFNRRMRPTYQTLHRRMASTGGPWNLSYRFLSDGREWASPWERPADEALQEVAVHGIDLLPWLLGSRVASTRARAVDPTTVVMEIETDTGARATIRAGVSDRYVERIVATGSSRTFMTSPGGILETTGIPERIADVTVRVHGVAATVLRRLRGRPGLTAQSFRRQLRAFAVRARCGEGAPAAGAEDGVRAVRVVEAARRSLSRDGAWVALDDHGLGAEDLEES